MISDSDLISKVHSLEQDFHNGKYNFHEFRVLLDAILGFNEVI